MILVGFFWPLLPRDIFRTQSKVSGAAFFANWFSAVNYFCKEAPS